MTGKEKKLGDWVRIVLAVASKDVVDAIKNRVTISIILGVAMIVLSTQALPLLLKLQPEKNALVYDPSRSTFVEEYGRGETHRLIEMPSRDIMLDEIGGIVAGTIGLELPGDFAETLEGTGPLEIEVYFSHAMKDSEVDEMVAFFSRELSDSLGREVVLNAEGTEVYPGPDAGGHPFMVSITLVMSVMVVGMSLVPLLMIEEKEKHTIEVLMISPASYGQVVLGAAGGRGCGFVHRRAWASIWGALRKAGEHEHGHRVGVDALDNSGDPVVGCLRCSSCCPSGHTPLHALRSCK